MSTDQSAARGAGIVALCGGLAIFAGVMGLKMFFGYPNIIRAEPCIIMEKLYETRSIVPYLYYFGVGGAGICVLFFSILFAKQLQREGDEIWSSLGKTCGIISGVLLYVGIIRYSILFPKLAALRHADTYDPKTIDLIFTTMNTYVGESVAEHSQFLFTSLMMVFFGIASLRTKLLPLWLVLFSFAIAVVDLIGNLEHFGFAFAFWFNRTGPKMFAAWLLIAGIILITGKSGSATRARFSRFIGRNIGAEFVTPNK